MLLVFVVVATTTTLRHEMWRDEIHAWQAVATAASTSEAVSNIRTEGHPFLWFAVLYPLSRLTADPLAMQIAHLLIATAVAALILFFSPFAWPWRALVVLGYFPLYEYGVISRNYALGALLLVGFCIVYPSRSERPLTAAVLLFLLAQASVYTVILSFALGLMWIVDDRTGVGGRPPSPPGLPGTALVVWLAGLIASTVQLAGARPVMHPLDPEKLGAPSRVWEALAGPWRGYVPVPRFRFAFWNSNLLDGLPDGAVVQAALGLALMAVLCVGLRRRPAVLTLFVAGSLGLVAFSLLVYVGHVRHFGHHMLLVLGCVWLLMADPDDGGGRRAVGPGLGVVLALLLVLNAGAGMYAVARDWRDPFSAARDVADAIRDMGLVDHPIVGHRDVPVATVCGYLGRPIYFPTLGRAVSYIPWGAQVQWGVDDDETLRQAAQLAHAEGKDAIVIFNRSGEQRPKRLGPATRIRHFPEAIVPSERFDLYRLPAGSGSADPQP